VHWLVLEVGSAAWTALWGQMSVLTSLSAPDDCPCSVLGHLQIINHIMSMIQQ